MKKDPLSTLFKMATIDAYYSALRAARRKERQRVTRYTLILSALTLAGAILLGLFGPCA